MNRLKDIVGQNHLLVAGAGGFIGGHLVSRLRKVPGLRIRCVDRKPLDMWFQHFDDTDNLVLDLSDPANCRQAVQDCSAVFNLACDMGGMGFIELQRARCMLSVLVNTNLLVAARDVGCRRYLFTSSACVYAAEHQVSTEAVALREEDAYPAMPEDGYGWEKLFSERMCRHFREDFGVPTRVVRLHNVYGPMGTYDGGREKAPAAISRKVAQAKLDGGRTIPIWGDGQQTRSFMYIDDCLHGLIEMFCGDFHDPINLGSAELVSINQLVDLVEEIASMRLDRIYEPDRPKGVRGRNSDNSLIRQVLGWEPSTPLRQGLETTYHWIESQLRDGGNPAFRAP